MYEKSTPDDAAERFDNFEKLELGDAGVLGPILRIRFGRKLRAKLNYGL
jgi:hypothetical protein